jgi:hypothetical protein
LVAGAQPAKAAQARASGLVWERAGHPPRLSEAAQVRALELVWERAGELPEQPRLSEAAQLRALGLVWERARGLPLPSGHTICSLLRGKEKYCVVGINLK